VLDLTVAEAVVIRDGLQGVFQFLAEVCGRVAGVETDAIVPVNAAGGEVDVDEGAVPDIIGIIRAVGQLGREGEAVAYEDRAGKIQGDQGVGGII